MSLRPARATWFELLTAREDLMLAVETLARTGRVELETRSDSRARLNLPNLHARMDEYNRLARAYHPYWPHTDLQPGSVSGRVGNILDKALQHLLAWEMEAAPLARHLEQLQAEASDLHILEAMLMQSKEAVLDFSLLSNAGPTLASRLFILPAGSRIEQLPGTLLVKRINSAKRDFLLAVGVPADIESLTTELATQKARVIDLPPYLQGKRDSAMQQVKRRQVELDSQEKALRNRIDALAVPHHLAESLGGIGRLEWFLTHVNSLPVTENFAWVTGWTSDLDGKLLKAALSQANVKAIIDFPATPREKSAPVVMQNPWWARPFELFAKLLGTPAADEADPSRLLALLAPLLFGYMFGDVGHGLVLLMVGLLFRKRWPIVRILIANGLAAMIFGFVFGSIFGSEDLIPALWVHPIDYPLTILLVPLGGGVLILLLGLILNAMESYWRGELLQWLQVEAAVVVMYLSLVAGFFRPEILIVTLGALLWFFTGSLLHAQRKIISSLLLAAGTLIESMLQLIINTISFMRVGAFALAHAGLSLAFIIMAEASDNIVGSVVILLLGNLLVLTLEGLVVTIQTTRLILFEFFIRFLRGTGRMFRPLTAPTNHFV